MNMDDFEPVLQAASPGQRSVYEEMYYYVTVEVMSPFQFLLTSKQAEACNGAELGGRLMASEASFAAVERTECRALGTVKLSDLQVLQDLLIGLSGSHGLIFRHHEVVLKNDDKPPLLVHLIRSLEEETGQAEDESSSSSSNKSKEATRWGRLLCMHRDVSLHCQRLPSTFADTMPE